MEPYSGQVLIGKASQARRLSIQAIRVTGASGFPTWSYVVHDGDGKRAVSAGEAIRWLESLGCTPNQCRRLLHDATDVTPHPLEVGVGLAKIDSRP